MLCSFNYKKKRKKSCFVHCNLFAGINVVLELQKHQRKIIPVLVMRSTLLMFLLTFYVNFFFFFKFKLCSVKEENIYLNRLCNVKRPFLACLFVVICLSLWGAWCQLDMMDKKKKKRDESAMIVQTLDVQILIYNIKIMQKLIINKYQDIYSKHLTSVKLLWFYLINKSFGGILE